MFHKNKYICDLYWYFLLRDIIALVRDKMYARIDLDGFSIHQVIPLSLSLSL